MQYDWKCRGYFLLALGTFRRYIFKPLVSIFTFFPPAAASLVWTGINGNRNTENCTGTQCNGVAVWWYDETVPFMSGSIPDKLASKSVLSIIFSLEPQSCHT